MAPSPEGVKFMGDGKLRLGKGTAFVKSRLLRLPQEMDEWEVDFHELPCPTGQQSAGYLGIVLSNGGVLLREIHLEESPDVNDLADLLARAMKSPFDGPAHRPSTIILRNCPEWSELFSHLGQLDIEIELKKSLPKCEKAFKQLARIETFGEFPISETIFQFKITLRDSKPPIWRRIQVKDISLDKFHEAIQTAMGWTNSHLHHFQMAGGEMYGDPELVNEDCGDIEYRDSTRTGLLEILPNGNQPVTFEYEYDFGDSWHHDIEFEGRFHQEKGEKYPRCIDGSRACPPEDVGGIWGYEEFLDALANKNHERHAEFKRWVGSKFDPEKFDAVGTTRRMQRGLPNWRGKR
jgi:hypothetical protein